MCSFDFELMQRELLRNIFCWSRSESSIACFIHWWLLSILHQFSHWMVWPAWFLLLCKHCYSVITIHLLHETSVYAAFSFWKRFMLHLECHLLQDSLCVFPWTSSKISDGFIFHSYPLHRFCIPLLILSISTKRSGNCISMSFFQDWQKKEVMVTMDPVLFVTRHACRYSLCSCKILLLAADIYIESSYSTLQLIFMSNPPACVKGLVFMSTAEHKQVLWVHICLCSCQYFTVKTPF